MPRHAQIHRKTNETEVTVSLDLDGQGDADVRTGIGFYDHLWGHVAHHGLFNLTIQASGDLDVDEHHTVEDVAIAFGQALNAALGERAGIVRMADAWVAMDEALAHVVVDLSGPTPSSTRPSARRRSARWGLRSSRTSSSPSRRMAG